MITGKKGDIILNLPWEKAVLGEAKHVIIPGRFLGLIKELGLEKFLSILEYSARKGLVRRVEKDRVVFYDIRELVYEYDEEHEDEVVEERDGVRVTLLKRTRTHVVKYLVSGRVEKHADVDVYVAGAEGRYVKDWHGFIVCKDYDKCYELDADAEELYHAMKNMYERLRALTDDDAVVADAMRLYVASLGYTDMFDHEYWCLPPVYVVRDEVLREAELVRDILREEYGCDAEISISRHRYGRCNDFGWKSEEVDALPVYQREIARMLGYVGVDFSGELRRGERVWLNDVAGYGRRIVFEYGGRAVDVVLSGREIVRVYSVPRISDAEELLDMTLSILEYAETGEPVHYEELVAGALRDILLSARDIVRGEEPRMLPRNRIARWRYTGCMEGEAEVLTAYDEIRVPVRFEYRRKCMENMIVFTTDGREYECEPRCMPVEYKVIKTQPVEALPSENTEQKHETPGYTPYTPTDGAKKRALERLGHIYKDMLSFIFTMK